MLRVADDGPGIDPDLQGEVFTIRARRHVALARKAGSTGLGLSIVDAVVKAHGGTIIVRSEPGTPCSPCVCRSRISRLYG